MQQALVNRYYNKLFSGIIGLLAIYLIARACSVDMTDDEAWSFYNVKHFWYVEALCSGNTHWLNFLAIKITLLFGVEQTWQIRWFSVLSGIGFMLIVYQWIKTLDRLSIKLFAFGIVLLHPYLFEYLSLARGYSSGLCFMALSLLFLVKEDQDGKKMGGSYALLFAGISAIANFNFLYYFSAFCMLYFYTAYFKNGISFLKNKWFYVEVLYTLGIMVLVLRALLFIRQCSNDIAGFGGGELVPSVFKSYLKLLCYGNFSTNETTMTISAYVVFGIVLVSALFGILKFELHKSHLLLYVSILWFIMLGLTVVNKWCFSVLYPTDRTALMFYPLTGVILAEFMKWASGKYTLAKSLIGVISGALIVNFLMTINFKKGLDHPYCEGSASYFECLDKMNVKKAGIPLDLYCVYSKYYHVTGTRFEARSVNTFGHDVQWIEKSKLEDFDYLLLLPPYSLSYYKPSSVKLKGIKYFSGTGALILEVVKPG